MDELQIGEQGKPEGAEDLLNEEIDALNDDGTPKDMDSEKGQDGDDPGKKDGGEPDKQPDPMDQEHEIIWNGQPRKFPLKDIVRFAQMGFDYNHKNQELKRTKLDLETRQTELGKLVEFGNWWKKNPQVALKVKEMIESGEITAAEAEKIVASNDPVMQKLESLEQRLSVKEAKEDDAALNQEIGVLRKDLEAKGITHNWDTPGEDGRTFEEVVLDHAIENGFTTVKAAYRDLMFDNAIANTRELTEKEVLARLKKNKEVPDTDTPQKKRAVINKPLDVKGKTYDDLGREVMDELAQGVYG